MSVCGKLSGTQRCKFFFSFEIGINSLLQKGWFVEDLIVQTLVFSFSFTGRVQCVCVCVCVCVICTRVCDFSLLSFLRSYLNPQGLYVADVLDSFVTACVSVLLVLTSWSSKSHCQMCLCWADVSSCWSGITVEYSKICLLNASKRIDFANRTRKDKHKDVFFSVRWVA